MQQAATRHAQVRADVSYFRNASHISRLSHAPSLFSGFGCGTSSNNGIPKETDYYIVNAPTWCSGPKLHFGVGVVSIKVPRALPTISLSFVVVESRRGHLGFILLRARFVMDVARPRGSCFAPCKLLDLTRRTETTAVATKFTRYGRCGDVDGARPVTAVMGRLRHFGGRIVLLGEKLYLLSFGVLLLGSQACDEFLKSRGWCGFRQDHPEFGVSWGCSDTLWIRWFRWSAGK